MNTQHILTVGASPDNDLILDYPMISSHHAKLTVVGPDAMLEDMNSTNGTYLGSQSNRVTRTSLAERDVVYFGSFRVPARRLLATARGDTNAQSVTMLPGDECKTVGRSPDCDFTLADPMISWQHARIVRRPDGTVVEDLGSTNGTFVNGQPIDGPTLAADDDVITIGRYSITTDASGALRIRDMRGDVSVEARNVGVCAGQKQLLSNVSLTLHPGEFVGLMGPSGAGKSTLMNALNGYTPPTYGEVLVNGQNLYSDYDQFRGQLGYVPQDDIIHGDLTVGQALFYTAKLRLPPDYSDAEIRQRIAVVIEQLGLQGTEDVLIGSPDRKGISGGQRKRVNLAMELLTDPSVLFLDEPTSGLSSEDALMVMRLLRDLADSGKTILLTIHQPSLEAYRLMDNLVVVAKDTGGDEPGQLAFYGPAWPNAVEFFQHHNRAVVTRADELSPEGVLRGLAKKPAKEWVSRYDASEEKRTYVHQRVGKTLNGVSASPGRTVGRVSSITQLRTLVKRGLSIKLRDLWNTTILLAQAPVISLLLIMVFSEHARADESQEWFKVAKAMSSTLFMLSVMSIWCGCSNSAREIVAERSIYRRERMVNLRITSYLASKLVLLIGLSAIQCAIMLGVVYWANKMQGPWWQMYGVLLLSASVGVGIGLTVSVLARTSEVAIAALPIVIMPMILLGGSMQPPHELNAPSKAISVCMPSRWTFESLLVMEAERHADWSPAVTSDTGSLSASESLVQVQDMAERFFPRDEGRHNSRTGSFVLCGMLTLCVLCISAVIHSQDIH